MLGLLRTRTFLVAMIASCLASAVFAQTTFNGPGGTINASGAATPYPSDIAVTGVGQVSDITVTITGLAHTWANDIDIVLVGPNSQNIVLMADVGGSADWTGQDITFSDLGTGAPVPGTAGTYLPSNQGTANNGAPCPTPSALTTLASAFVGGNGDGTWSLYIWDDTGGDSGSWTGWSITLTSASTPFATPSSGSALTGNSGSGFAGSVDSGVALANFSIDCNDPDTANIDATITTTGGAPGVTQPADVTAGAVVFALAWTGTPTTIGVYTYTVTLSDGTNTTIFDVVITVTDPTPAIQQPVPPIAGSPILITEFTTNTGFDGLEIQNVTNAAFDATGWQVIISDDYTDINIANTVTQTLGNMAAGQTMHWNDSGGPLWGSNIFWSPTGTGWIMIIDTTGAIRDFVAFNWTDAQIQAMNLTAGGFSGITPGSEWSGNGVTDAGNVYARNGTSDNNDLTDWVDNGATNTWNATNPGLTLPFTTSAGAIISGADPAWIGTLLVGQDLGVTFTATDTSTTETLSFTITVTGGTLTAAQAGFNESFPFTPAGSVSPSSASLTGTAAQQGSIELTVQVSDGTNTDSVTYTVNIVAPQEMDVLRGTTPVADGGTDTVNIVSTGTNLTYTIENTGGLALNLTGTAPDYVVVTAGTNINTLSVTTQPTTPVAGAGSTTFVINVVPNTASLAGDPYDFTVSIANDDSDENPYNFTVSGNAVTNVPPAVANQAGSNWVDAGGGLFTLTVNAGDTINDTLEATDATPDNMTVNITATPIFAGLTSQPANITTATAGPISLTWTGTADGSNNPNNYDWTIEISDGVSTTTITARIILQNTAPQHAAATGISGDGSAGTPYLTTYAENDAATVTVNLANVTDPNTGQTLNLTNVAQSSGPTTGSGFTFSLVGGVLSVAPSATLVANDVGTQVFSMDIDDGTATVTVNVSITVFGNSGSITFDQTTLPAGTVGSAYTTTLTVTGATAPNTFSVIAGSLPAGLSLNGATGEISGTPTVAATSNFTIRVVDSGNDSAQQAFSITINTSGGGGGGGGGGDDGGCSTGTNGFNWLALLGLLGVAALAFRMRGSKA